MPERSTGIGLPILQNPSILVSILLEKFLISKIKITVSSLASKQEVIVIWCSDLFYFFVFFFSLSLCFFSSCNSFNCSISSSRRAILALSKEENKQIYLGQIKSKLSPTAMLTWDRSQMDPT